MDIFTDRADAGRRLAAALPDFDPDTTVVLALPRGGVPVAAEICRAKGLPLDLVLVRKIGAPGQPELALGAVVDGDPPQVVVNDRIAQAFGLDRAAVEAMAGPAQRENEARRGRFLRGGGRLPLAGRTAVVVDDGVATGATLRAALAAIRRAGAGSVMLALPAAPPEFLAAIRGEVDAVTCILSRADLHSVGAYYRHFGQTSEAEVIRLMAEFGPRDGTDAGSN